jgi:TolB-like protein/DNA-binding winged helix-turn-helix (wHTH) protein/Tfp pilus assembly protein PilF
MTLRSGFTLGSWTVYPLEGRLVDGAIESRVQPKSMDVLLCLAGADGAVVEREHLLLAVWGGRAQSDEPLTRCIGELRRALGDTRDVRRFILTVPKRGYQLLQTAVATSPPLVAADEPDTPPVTAAQRALRLDTLKKIGMGLGLLILAAVIQVGVERLLEDSDPPQTLSASGRSNANPSIAVLPVVNISDDIENDYFSDGLTETILHALARMPEILVTARTSTFLFKNTNADVRDIGLQLGVTHILEGSVRRSENRIRVTAHLVQASDGFRVWSENYDDELDDIFDVQDEIATKVAHALRGTFQDSPTEFQFEVVETYDSSAYDVYLRALASIRQFSFESLQQAERQLQNSLAIDPEFGDARFALGNLYVDQAYTGMTVWSEAMPNARREVEMLITANPDNVLAQALEAKIDGFDGMQNADYEQIRMAIVRLEKAIALRPNSVWIYAWMAQFQLAVGELDAALESIERGLTIDRFAHAMSSKQGEVLYAMGRFEEAAEAFKRVRELAPGMAGGYSSGGTVAKADRDYEAYVALMMRSMELDPGDHELALRFAGTLYSLGLVEEAEPWFQRGLELAPDAAATMRFALERDWLLGNFTAVRDRAKAMLENDVENRLGSVFAASMYYVQALRKLGTLADAPAFLGEISPAVTDSQTGLSHSRDVWIKLALIDALFTLDPGLAKEHAMFLSSYVSQTFPQLARIPRIRVSLDVAAGLRDSAIEIALEQDLIQQNIARGVSTFSSVQYLSIATLNSLIESPDIATRISEIEMLRATDAKRMQSLIKSK